MFKLILVQGPAGLHKEYPLESKTYRLGRGSECDISIDSEFMSKVHAVIRVFPDHIEIEDLNSRNGTFVNGVMVKKANLHVRDRISFQNITFEIKTEHVTHPSIFSERKKSSAKQFQWFFQTFERLSQKLEWKYITLILTFLFVTLAFLGVVPPLINENHIQLQKEALKRGEFVLKHIARENQKYLSIEQGSLITDNLKLSTHVAESEERLTLVNIIDPKTKRILAPSERLNQSIENDAPYLRGTEAKSLMIEKLSETEFLISQPIWIYSREENREVIGAIVQAIFQAEGVGYTKHQYLNILLRSFLVFILIGVGYYISLQGFTYLALKKIDGEIQLASRKGYRHIELQTKFHEISEILESINKVFRRTRELIQKMPENVLTEGEKQTENIDEILKHLIQAVQDGVIVLNPSFKIIKINSAFSKMVNIPIDSVDQNIFDVVTHQEWLRNITLSLNETSQKENVQEEFYIESHKYHLATEVRRNPNNEVDFYLLNIKQVE